MTFGDLMTRIGLAIAVVFFLAPFVRGFLFRGTSAEEASADAELPALDKPVSELEVLYDRLCHNGTFQVSEWAKLAADFESQRKLHVKGDGISDVSRPLGHDSKSRPT